MPETLKEWLALALLLLNALLAFLNRQSSTSNRESLERLENKK